MPGRPASTIPRSPPRVQHFGTQDLPPERRFAEWSRRFGRLLGYAGLAPSGDGAFEQTLTQVDLGAIRFLRLQGSAVSSRARGGELQDAALRPMQLLMQLGQGATTLIQGREARIGQGDMVLLDAREDFRLMTEPATDLLAVGFPEPLVARWLPFAQDVVALRLARGTGWASTLSVYLRSLTAGLLERIESPFEEEIVGEHILSMLCFALAQHGFPMSVGNGVSERDRMLHARMCGWIRDNYSNPDINATKLARQFNVSVRHVHKVFAEAGRGSTFHDVLKHERLEAAVRMLRTARVSRTFIAQIAERCGFSDPAYFGLVFRKAYGCSPGTFLRRGGEAIKAPPAPMGSKNKG
jgi:AraC-like DNA-binding protein